jgi:hypothetical protein
MKFVLIPANAVPIHANGLKMDQSLGLIFGSFPESLWQKAS